MSIAEDQNKLLELAKSEIDQIKSLPQPVVRVCGPLTCDGPEGYERNAKRLEVAENVLELKGMTVWKFGQSEEYIKQYNFDHDDIFNYFHKPVLESGLISEAYFLNRWRESGGATKEREAAEAAGITIKEFPEEWFDGEI